MCEAISDKTKQRPFPMMIAETTVSSLPRHAAKQSLNQFRNGVYTSLTRRADVLFELSDAVACSTSPVTDVARLSLEAEQHRGHGGVYDGLASGRINNAQLSWALAEAPLPMITGPDGRARIVLAVDVCNWLRPDAATSPHRSFCHTYGRGKGQAQMIPGWPYSFVAALETGASSWTAILDATRILPEDDATTVTAAQLRNVITNLRTAGHWRQGDPDILIVTDAGYDGPRLAWLISDLPVVIICRVRSDRVYYAPAGRRAGPTKGRQPRHGAKLVLREPDTRAHRCHGQRH